MSGMLAAIAATHAARGVSLSSPARESITPVNVWVRLSMSLIASELVRNQQRKRILNNAQPNRQTPGILAIHLNVNAWVGRTLHFERLRPQDLHASHIGQP